MRVSLSDFSKKVGQFVTLTQNAHRQDATTEEIRSHHTIDNPLFKGFDHLELKLVP
jgi:hypothetical protein